MAKFRKIKLFSNEQVRNKMIRLQKSQKKIFAISPFRLLVVTKNECSIFPVLSPLKGRFYADFAQFVGD